MQSWRWAAALIAVLANAFGATALGQTPDPDLAPPALRLPDGARPTRYAATLTIVPGAAKAQGEIAIDVTLDRPHPLLWLNATALTISAAVVDDATTRTTIVAGNDQFVGLAFEPALTAGSHRLKIVYEADQNRNTVFGIFTLEDGADRYTMTQFEATSARRAFPCFDEPGFKVPWRLALRVPNEMIAVANSPIVAEEPGGDGMKVVRFEETQPLPSYLIAFAVGPWQIVDAGSVGHRPTPLRFIAPRGRTPDLDFVAHAYPELFAQEERWFGTAYPFAKLDQIAIPLTVRFAMENAGLITYGAANILRPDSATPSFRHGAANVGAHEMAHQWFGNLVTMRWWDDIWLNEAFATWFAEKTVDGWRPGYERGAQRVHARAEAIEADSLVSARRIRQPIVTRGDIFNAFDPITYEKGATVIGMFEGWMGEEPFRRGVHAFLDRHRYGSATVVDFLGAISSPSGKPIAPAFASFLDQNGVPEVGVKLACFAGGPRLELTQRRHASSGSPPARQAWQIPVCVRYGGTGAMRTACTLLTQTTGALALQGSCPAFVFANAGGRGYYVPSYHGDLLARLKKHRSELSTAEYASVLYDLRPLVRSGAVDAGEALEWVRLGARSRDRHVIVAAIELASFVRDKLVADADRSHLASFVRRTFGPRARALGFVPHGAESDDDQLLRRTLLRFAAPDDAELAAEARRLALAWIHDRTAIDPGLVDVVLWIAARTGDATLLDAMRREALATPNRLDRRNLMIALFSFAEPALANSGLELLLDPAVDIREAVTALGSARDVGPPNPAIVDFIAANFEALAARVDRDTPGGWPHYAARLCDARDRTALDALWKPRVDRYAGAERNLAQALEAIERCGELRAREAPRARAFLARY